VAAKTLWRSRDRGSAVRSQVRSDRGYYQKYPKTRPDPAGLWVTVRPQVKDLEATIKKADVDLVIIGTADRLTRELLKISQALPARAL